jgi:pimeloyl-ACP methyl ester carboxylesterase
VHDAVTYLLSLPEQVDPTKLAALGYSYGSAHCVRTATLDRRVKAVVSLASLTNGEWLLNWAHPDRDAWDRRIFADRIARVGGSEPEYIRVSPEVGEDMQEAEKTSFMAAPDGAEFYSRMKAEVTPQWENKLTLQSVFWVRGYQMESALPTLAPTPWLMLVDERSVEMYRPVWDKSTGPKEWGVIPGAHFDVVQGEGLVKAFELSLDFLKRHLGF